jgi:hypothetical protein
MKAIAVGLPRSGSTLLCRMIHSADDCVCLSEPHLELQILKTCETLKDRKISKHALEIHPDTEMPLHAAMSELARNYRIAAFKETYRLEPPKQRNVELLETYKTNGYKVVGIIRSPLENFNSWKMKEVWGNWTSDVGLFIETYRSFVQFCDGRAIRFEDLLASPEDVVKALNIRYAGLGKITATFGDEEALVSTLVGKEKKHKSILSADDIKAIEESGIMGLYESTRAFQ